MPLSVDPLAGPDAGAGSQPAVSAGGKVPFGGFGPSATPTSQAALGVYASVDQQGAPSQAKYLASQLQQSLQSLHFPMMEAEKAEGAQKEQQGEAEGAAAATMGAIDPQTAAANSAYQVGAARIVAQQHAQKAVLLAYQTYNDPNSGWQNLPLEDSKPGAGDGLASKIDQLWKQQLGGLETDPVTASAIAPLIQHASNELLGKAYTDKVTNTQAAAVNSATSLAAAQAATGGTLSTGKVFDYGQQLNTLKALFGGNGVAAQAALSSALIDKSVAMHDPRILDQIQPAPGLALSPQLQLKIAEARQRVNLLVTQDNEARQRSAQAPIVSSILSGKDPTAALQQYLTLPGADPKFVQSAMGFFHSLSTNQAVTDADSQTAMGIDAGIAKGDIGSPAQLLDAINPLQLSSRAKQQLLTRGLGELRTVQSESQDDPYVKAGLDYLDQQYKPARDMMGKLLAPNAAPQYAGVLLDYRTRIAKAISQGTAPQKAAQDATTAVEKEWGDPAGASQSPAGSADTAEGRANLIRYAGENPQALLSAHVSGQDILTLVNEGLVPQDAANRAAEIILRARHSPR